ncbi:MAG: hypothetical protein ACTSUI_05020, partial [Promethearchaeota archaeon]
NLNYVYGIHQEGISIPSQELIEQGIIGDARLTTRGIQGYSSILIECFGLVAISYILRKKIKRTIK